MQSLIVLAPTLRALLQRFMMDAGRQSEKSQSGTSEEWQGFGAGIPDGPENDDDDERLEGVGSSYLSLSTMSSRVSNFSQIIS